MNHGTKTIALPELTANLLRDGGCLIDNLFADLWKQTGMKARLDRIGFHKRSGTSANELVAQGQTKPQMAGDMIRRAQRAGIEADYTPGYILKRYRCQWAFSGAAHSTRQGLRNRRGGCHLAWFAP